METKELKDSSDYGDEWYTCVTGEKIRRHKDTRIMIYEKKKLSQVLTDPITQDWIKYPVLFNGNLYDELSLQKWLRTSNIDPLTGETIPSGMLKLVQVNVMRYILLCLQECESDSKILLFHSHLNNLSSAQVIGEGCGRNKKFTINRSHSHCLDKEIDSKDISFRTFLLIADPSRIKPEMEMKKIVFERIDFSKITRVNFVECTFINCIIPLNESDTEKNKMINCQITTDLFNPRIENLLDYCLVNNELIYKDNKDIKKLREKSAYLTNSGYIITEKMKNITMETLNSNFLNDTQSFVYFNIFKSKVFCPVDRLLDSFSECFKPLKVLNRFAEGTLSLVPNYQIIDCGDSLFSTIQIRSSEEKVAKKIEEIQQEMKHDSSLLLAKNKLSNVLKDPKFTDEIMKMNAGAMGDQQDCFLKLRRRLGFPFVVDQDENIYGKDLSMMDFTNQIIRGKSLKNFYFSGCDLFNTKFINCEFSSCDFTCANVYNVIFIGCQFTYSRKFHKTISYETIRFINCNFV
jgi:hypothetical protein